MSEVAEELVQAASTEIAEYCPIAAGLAELKRKYANVVVDVSTTKALDEAKRVRAEIREPRYETEKIRKALKAPALAHAKLIDTEAARITAELLAIETPWDDAIKAEEARKEAEKAAREQAEKARIMAVTERIAGIRQYVELAASCRTAARIHELQEKLVRISLDGFEEFADEAATAHADAMKRVEALLVEKHLQEQEQEKAKAEQAAAAAKLAAERAEFAAAQAAAKAEADRAAKEIADARAAHEAEVLRVTKANREAAIAEADRIATERQRLDDERKAFEAQVAARAEADRMEAMHTALMANPEQVAAVLGEEQPQTKIEEVSNTYHNLPDFLQPEPACCAPDGICTDACSNKPAEPSDGDLIWTAQTAIATEYGMTTQQAFNRLKAIDWTL